MDKKTKNWIVVFVLFCVACLVLFAVLRKPGSGTVAVISVDGVELQRVDLSRVRRSYDIPIDTPYGHNTVHVEPGAISVTEADCPDKVCVAMGKLTGDGIPIICMPHRLLIEIEGDSLDA